MKILQLNKFFYLRGGAEKHYFDLMALLASRGHEVIPFSMHDPRNEASVYSKYFVSNVQFDPPNIATLYKAGRIIYSFEARRKLTQLLRDTKPDIAHVHLFYHHLSPSVLLALRDAGIPIVMTIHDWQVLSPNYSLATPPDHVYTVEEGKDYWGVFRTRALKQSYAMSFLAALAATIHHKLRWYEDTIDHLIAPSLFVKEMFIAYGWDPKKISHIPHFMRDIPVSRETPKEPALLYAGRLSWEKGIDRLVTVWGEEKIPYQLLIAGRGPLEEKLKCIVREQGLSDRVAFLGFLSERELGKRIQESAAIIAPSITPETFGLSIMEGFAHGTGAIASDRGAFPELVKESEGGGVLFSWDKKGSLKKALDAYMSNEEGWKAYGEKGRKRVHKEHTPGVYYEALMKLYERLV